MVARSSQFRPQGRTSRLTLRSSASALVLLAGLGLGLPSARAAEPGAQAAPQSDLAAVKARGKLILLSYPLLEGTFVGVDMDAMRKSGLQLKDLRDPAVFRGIDIELIKGFAESLGVKLEIHPVTSGYDGLLPALLKGEGDLVASSYSITAQRQASADFSDPYVTGSVVVAVPMESPIKALSDLRGKRVAVMHGSSQLERVQALDLDLKVQLTDFALQNYVAVTEGKADFTVLDSYAPVGAPVSAVYPDLKVALSLSEFSYSIAARKGSDLLAPLNAYLAQLKKSGELGRILSRDLPEAGAAPASPPKP